jgi:O-antigen/teichoic acid export membrane protein
VAVVALIVSLQLIPSESPGTASAPPPRWDVPARMVLATAVVLALTALAPRLGATLSGLLATYPLFAAILTAFGHRLQGAGAAVSVLRGLLFGLFSFVAFCLVLALALVPLGIAGAFVAAIAVALLVQGASLWRLRSPRLTRGSARPT